MAMCIVHWYNAALWLAKRSDSEALGHYSPVMPTGRLRDYAN